MPEYTRVLEFNNNSENDGIDGSRSYTGSHQSKGKIELGFERVEGRGKEFVEVKLLKENQKQYVGIFVAKSFATKAKALKELKKCWYFEKFGIPIPPTHRYVEQDGKHYVIYTDLTQGGKNDVWSINNLQEQDIRPDLTQDQIDEVAYQIRAISEIAAAHDFMINRDAYFVVKQPNGSVYVLIGDLGYGVSGYPVSSENNDVADSNKAEADRIIECIKGD